MIISFILAAFMCIVCYSDATRYRIPNWLVGGIILLFALAYATAGDARPDWREPIVAFGIVTLFGLFVFSRKWMGGGDVKLLIALSLWVGARGLAEFLLIFALIGGVLSIVLWLGRKVLLWLVPAKKLVAYPKIAQEGAPVPYGLAIASAFLYLLAVQKIPLAVF